MPPAVLFVLGLVVLFVVFMILMARQEKKRTEALKQVSATLGLTFEAKGDLARIRALGDLSLFDLGHSKDVRNVMSGRSDAVDFQIFDYHYRVGSGKQSMAFEQTVAFYPGQGNGLPDFILTPENPLTRRGEKKGFQDIDFDSSPAFSAQYHLRGPDEAAIRTAFSDDLRRALERLGGWSVDVHAGNVGICHFNRRVKPEDLAGFLQQSREMLRALCRR